MLAVLVVLVPTLYVGTHSDTLFVKVVITLNPAA